MVHYLLFIALASQIAPHSDNAILKDGRAFISSDGFYTHDSTKIYKDLNLFTLEGIEQIEKVSSCDNSVKIFYDDGFKSGIELYENNKLVQTLDIKRYSNGLFCMFPYKIYHEGKIEQQFLYYLWTRKHEFITVYTQADIFNNTNISPETTISVFKKEDKKIQYFQYHYKMLDCKTDSTAIIYNVDHEKISNCFQFLETAKIIYKRGKYYKMDIVRQNKYAAKETVRKSFYFEGESLFFHQLSHLEWLND